MRVSSDEGEGETAERLYGEGDGAFRWIVRFWKGLWVMAVDLY